MKDEIQKTRNEANDVEIKAPRGKGGTLNDIDTNTRDIYAPNKSDFLFVVVRSRRRTEENGEASSPRSVWWARQQEPTTVMTVPRKGT